MEKVSLKLLANIGITLEELDKSDRGLVIREQKVRYILPAKYGDELGLEGQILKRGHARIIMVSNIYLKNNLIAKGELDFVCVNKFTGSPIGFE